jgi:hypothetical protein
MTHDDVYITCLHTAAFSKNTGHCILLVCCKCYVSELTNKQKMREIERENQIKYVPCTLVDKFQKYKDHRTQQVETQKNQKN